MQRMEASGAWELETNAKIILTKLGIQDFYARIGSSSGGYRKRIALAAAHSQSRMCCLMEPTNHLDALSVEWLQSYPNRYRGAILLLPTIATFLIASPTVLSKLTGAIFTPTLVTILTI